MKKSTNIEKLLSEGVWLSKLARSLVARDEDAEDLVQETWLTVLRRPKEESAIGRGLLRSIVRSRLVDRRRRESARRRREEWNAHPDGQVVSSNNVERMAIQKRMVEEIARLPEPLQDTIIRRYLDGYSVTQIARADEISESAVRKRLHRALEKLRGRLDGEWGSRSAWALVLCPFLRPQTTTLTSTMAGVFWGGVHMSTKLKVGIVVVAILVLWSANFVWEEEDSLLVGELGANKELQDHQPRRVDDKEVKGRTGEVLVSSPSPKTTAVDELMIRGRVVDESGQPVRDAVVLALPLGASEIPILEWRDPSPRTLNNSKTRRCRSSADGSFALALQRHIKSFSIKASREDYSPSSSQEFIPGEEDVKLVLRRGFSLRGRVHDLAGNAITGASISYRARTDGFSVERHGRSGDDGAFEIVGIPISDRFGSGIDQELLFCEAVGFAPRMVRKPIDYWTRRISRDGQVSFDILMSRGGAVRGQVIDGATLKPLPHVDVELWSLEGREATRVEGVRRLFQSISGPRLIAKTLTDSLGKYYIDQVPAAYGGLLTSHDIYDGGFVIRVLQPGYAVAAGPVETLQREGEIREVNLKLFSRGGIAGRVVDQNAQPVSGLNVYVRLKDWELIEIDMPLMVDAPPPRPNFLGWRHKPGARGLWWTQSNKDGRWSIPRIPCRLGQATEITIRQGSEARTLELWAGDSADLGDVTIFKAFALLRGLVVDEERKPLQGAQIWRNNERVVTGVDGRFDLRVTKWEDGTLDRGDFSIRMPGFVSKNSQIPEDVDNDIVSYQLQREHVLSGTVRDSTGMLVGGAHVWVYTSGKTPGNRVWSDHLGRALTGSDGRFRVNKLPPPPWDIGFATNFRDSETTELSIASDEKELDLILPSPIFESASFSLSVTGPKGNPIVAPVRASIFSEQVGEHISANRESLTTFSWDSVPAGEYQLEVTTQGCSRVVKTIFLVKGQARTDSVIMEPGIDLVIHLRFPKDVAQEVRWGVHVAHPVHGSFGDSGSGQAELKLEDLTPGRWRITANGRLRRDGSVFLAEPITLDLVDDGKPVSVSMLMIEAAVLVLELPVKQRDDPVIPKGPPGFVSDRQQADQHQGWWNLRSTYLERVESMRLVVRRDGRLLHDGSPLKFGSFDFDDGAGWLKRKVLPGQYVFELRRDEKLLWEAQAKIKPKQKVTLP